MDMTVTVAPKQTSESSFAASRQDDELIEVTVTQRAEVGEDTVTLVLAAVDGQPLPEFVAGSHVDIHIGPKIVRQYSLCCDPIDRYSYRLAIKLEKDSRGGSAGLHRDVRVGSRLRIGTPRNHFPLAKVVTKTYLIAGGIGVTPMVAMAADLRRQGADFELHYCARSRQAAAFAEELQYGYADHLRLHLDDGDEEQKFIIERDTPSAVLGGHLYVCGPAIFIDKVLTEALRKGWQKDQLHQERFAGKVDSGGSIFEVTAARSGVTVTVEGDRSIAAALIDAGVDVPLSCEQGVCGTCLVRVLEGSPDHRDVYQTDDEMAANDRIAVCCSRSRSARLVLEI